MVLSQEAEDVRILVAGTGSIGRRHIENLRKLLPGARYAFLRADARQDALSTEFRAHVVGTIASALAWRPTVAIIANPSDLHVATLLPILEAGIRTYIEKPVAIRDEDIDTLEKLVASDRLPATQVGCVLRFLGSLHRLKGWLDAGRLGRVVRVMVEAGQWLPDWRPTQDFRKSYSAHFAQGGGVVFDLVHELDLMCWFLGRLKILGAWGDHLSSLEIETEDVATLVLGADSGAQVCIQLDYVSRWPARRIHVVGELGSAVWDMPQRLLAFVGPDGKREESRDGFDVADAYLTAMRELVAGNGTTSIPLAEALPATRLAVQANALIRGGRP